jgi:hypothetical protein
MQLNKLILDEMVQGIGDQSGAWELLLLHPEREKIWSEAVKRREQLNRFCYFAAKWPKLVSTFKKTEAFVKDSLNLPEIGLFFDDPNLFAVTLNKPSSDSENRLSLSLEWGEEQIIEVRGTRQIVFNCDSLIRIHYSYGEGNGWLSSHDSWNFQPDEGAVLLTFIDSNVEDDDFESQAKLANSVSKIILLPM